MQELKCDGACNYIHAIGDISGDSQYQFTKIGRDVDHIEIDISANVCEMMLRIEIGVTDRVCN